MLLHPTERERLLLAAALCPDPKTAIAGWDEWSAQIALEDAPYAELRLVNAVYDNLTRIAADYAVPAKLRGMAKATFIHNNHVARASLPAIAILSARMPVVIAKGLAMCLRFGTWSSRGMGDADIHVPFEQLGTAAGILEDLGWTPAYRMTWSSLVHRIALRRSSWNATKDGGDIDLHWRAHAGAEDDVVARRMWETAERFDYFGRSVLVQSVESATITALDFSFVLGSPAERLQTVVDAAKLLPSCRHDILMPSLSRLKLLDALDEIASHLAQAQRPARATAASPFQITLHTTDRSQLPAPSVEQSAPCEDAVLRWPIIYRLWQSLGRKARIERLIVRLTGPFSKPLAALPDSENSYDLTDPAVMDRVGGVGWGWPEPDGSCVWSDRADIRLLVPLRAMADHVMTLDVAENRAISPNPRIDVFANGTFIATLDLRDDTHATTYVLAVAKHVLFGPWIELSFRPSPFVGTDPILRLEYFQMRGLPARRLTVTEHVRAAA